MRCFSNSALGSLPAAGMYHEQSSTSHDDSPTLFGNSNAARFCAEINADAYATLVVNCLVPGTMMLRYRKGGEMESDWYCKNVLVRGGLRTFES